MDRPYAARGLGDDALPAGRLAPGRLNVALGTEGPFTPGAGAGGMVPLDWVPDGTGGQGAATILMRAAGLAVEAGDVFVF